MALKSDGLDTLESKGENLILHDNITIEQNKDLQLCRICFATDGNLYSMKMDKNLDRAYSTLTGLPIQNEDNMPPYICNLCSDQLMTCIHFRNRSLRSHLLLQEVLRKHDCITVEVIQKLNGCQDVNSPNLDATQNSALIDQYNLETVNNIKKEIEYADEQCLRNESSSQDSDHVNIKKEHEYLFNHDSNKDKDNACSSTTSLHEEVFLCDIKIENDDAIDEGTNDDNAASEEYSDVFQGGDGSDHNIPGEQTSKILISKASTSSNDLSSLSRSAINKEENGDSLNLADTHENIQLIDLEVLPEQQINPSVPPQVRDSPLPLFEECNTQTSSTPKIQKSLDNQVVTLCGATPQGRALLKACERASQTGPLDSKIRNQLCAYLITQLSPAEEHIKLPENHALLQLSLDIARLFQLESAALYYCPSIGRGTFTPRKNTSGWLVNARNNRKRTLVSLGCLGPPAKRSRLCSTVDTVGSPAPETPSANTIDLNHLKGGEIELVQSAIEQLRGNTVGVPWSTIENLWSETVRARLYTCYQEAGNVQGYLNNYPVLKGPEGWRLLIQDFEALYPAAANGIETCRELMPKIISVSLNKIKSVKDKFVVATIKKITEQYTKTDDDNVKITGTIILLGCLYKISPASSRKGGTGSRPEVLKRLASFVPSENDVTGAIQEHALATPGPFQPFFIVVGEPYNIITSVFFCLTESTFWKFKNFPEAFDAGFKIIHAVACPYPTSCYSTWLAIQIAFYHIKTIYDDYSRSLKQLLLDLGLASTLQPYIALK